MVKLSPAKAALAVLLLAVIVYSNSLGGEFVYDDAYFVVKNAHIRSLANIPHFFVNPGASAFEALSQDVYRPVTAASYAIDYALWRLDTFGYHLANVVLHSVNGVLVLILVYLILGDLLLALLAGLFFVCHPIQTEVVAWISGRSSVLFLFFYLVSFICYILYRKKGGYFYLAGSLGAYLCSLYSKEMAVSLPILLIAYELHFSGGEGLGRKLRRSLPFFILAALFVVSRALVIGRVSQCQWWGGSPYHTFLTMLPAIAGYIRLLFWPIELCAFYALGVSTSFGETKVFVSALLLGAIVIALPYLFRRSRRASFFVWWFFITLIPVSNIVPLRAIMAERFLYLPSIGFSALAALGIVSLATVRYAGRAMKAVAVAVAAVMVVGYSARTMARNEDWRDGIAISKSILAVSPLNPWGFSTLGAAYSGKELHREAIKPLRKAIMLSPGYFAPMNILGFSYLELGRYQDAVTVIEEALRIKPDNLEALNSLGVAYANLKRYDDAIAQFRKAIAIDPMFATAHINLGAAFEQKGEPEKAIEAFSAVAANTRSKEDIAVSYIRIGDAYGRTGRADKAVEYYRKAALLCGRGMEDLRKIATDRLNARSVAK